MIERPHPEFARWFLRRFLIFWITGAVSFVLVFAAPALGLATLGRVAVVTFVLALAGGLAFMTYRLYHLACPQCGAQCKTGHAKGGQTWVARCERCDICWLLGVGTKASD